LATKLHLGCGKKYIPGYINIDCDENPSCDYNENIKNLWHPENTVDVIYCCHAFEYFDRIEAIEVLKNWHKVLRKGGILRLSVPDFEGIVKVYQKYGNLEHQGILGPLFGRWEIEAQKERTFLFHKTVYDFNSLKNMLESVGFTNVRRYDRDKTEHAYIDDYSAAYIPHMNRSGILVSLNVEATK
jgi:predicted SAM-dependent methyltransferase